MQRRRTFPSPGHLLCILVLGLATATAGVAANKPIDLTLAGSYHFGGDFELEDFEFGFIDLEVKDSDGLAVFLGFPVNRSLQIEAIAVRQQSEIVIDEGRFANDFVIGDVDLDYYHLGALWAFPIGQIEPYFALSAGITRFNFDIPGVSDESFPSLSIGGGFKARFTQHMGLRIDGRFFVTDLEDDFYSTDDRCRGHCDQGDNMVQGFVSAGLLFSF